MVTDFSMAGDVKHVALGIGKGAAINTACFCFGLILLTWTVDMALSAKRVALVIGKSNYRIGQLTNPKNDSEDIATAPGEVANDGTGGNGLFTAVLLRHVETPERMSRLQTRPELMPDSPSVVERRRKQLEAQLRNQEAREQAATKAHAGTERKKAEAEAERKAAAPHGKVPVMVRTTRKRDEKQWYKPGEGKRESFQDCIDSACTVKGPEMVVVPAGSFKMGSTQSEIDTLVNASGLDLFKNEGPQHKVTFAKSFAVGKYAVTFAEWDACVTDGGCGGYGPSDRGWGRGDHPVINVSWNDARNYVKWLSGKTGQKYRLLSEAEWEYTCRAGTTTRYWWGDTISKEQENYYGSLGKTVSIDSYPPNPWGLHQVHSNVWTWCEDVSHNNYNGAPDDGSAWTDGGNQAVHVVRGGSWIDYGSGFFRSAYRNWNYADGRAIDIGFRIARTL